MKYRSITTMCSIVLAAGILACLVVIFTGNWLIFAGPLALWVAVVTLPKVQRGKAKRHSLRKSKHRGVFKTERVMSSWRLYAALITWIAFGVTLWPKITKSMLSGTEIAAAMEHPAALFKDGRYREALAGFWAIEIPDRFPNRLAQKYHNIGLIQLKLNNPTEAKAALRQAVSSDPEDLDAYYMLACIAYEAKEYSEASEYLRDVESQLEDGANLPKAFQVLKGRLEASP